MDIKVRGGFGVREGLLEKAGTSTVTHAHNFDHVTYLLGPARVEKLEPLSVDEHGVPNAFKVVRTIDKARGGWVLIVAGTWHRITALADHVHYHCLFVHRTPDAAISDEFDGWQPAYA